MDFSFVLKPKIVSLVLIFVILVCSSILVYGQTVQPVVYLGGKDWSLKVEEPKSVGLVSVYAEEKVEKGVSSKVLFSTLKDLKTAESLGGKVEYFVSLNGLKVFKQLPLDKELNVSQYDFVNSTVAIRKGQVVEFRPENVVNSFACFNSSMYKVMHVFASKLIDAKNKSVWVDSDLKDGLLTVYLNYTWLAAASFPVVVDPSFGYTNEGQSQAAPAVDSFRGGNYEVPADAEFVTSVSFYSGYATVAKGLIAQMDGTVLGVGAEVTIDADEWTTSVFSAPIDVTSYQGQELVIGYIYGGDNNKPKYDAVADAFLSDSAYDYDGSYALPLYLASSTRAYSVYANYTVLAPVVTVPPLVGGEVNGSFVFVLFFMILELVLVLFRPNAWLNLVVGLFGVVFAGLVLSNFVVLAFPFHPWFEVFFGVLSGLVLLLPVLKSRG